MAAKNDGGYAFPIPVLSQDQSSGAVTIWQTEGGMTLRDHFASSALAGGLEQGIRDNMDTGWWHTPDRIAKRAYAVADAMLKERGL